MNLKSEQPTTEPYKLPNGWKWVRLGEVCVFEYGSGLPQRDRLGGSVPVFGSNGIVGYHNVAITKGPTIIIGRKGSIGQVNYSEIPCWPIDTTYYIDSSKTNSDLIWLYWLLKSLRLDLLNRATGVPGLNREDAYNQIVPLPPLPEQKRIATKLHELMQEVERARTACEKQLEAVKALPSAYLREVFESEEAKKWERKKLGELFHLQQGVSMSPKRRKGVSPYPFLRTSNVHWGRIDLSILDKMDFTDDEVAKLRLEPGDLLVCEGGEVGRTAIWEGQVDICLYQNHIHRLRKKNEGVIPEFFMYWMRAAFQVFSLYRGQASDTTIPNLSGSRLGAFVVPFPKLETQRRIATYLKEKMAYVERLKVSIEKQLEAINALPQAILRKAFRGEL
ncbi:MAG: restriction endonuclease subunit S [Candidatus Methanospirareceae archaeon]